MKTERLDTGEALERGMALPFALVRSLSQVTLGPVPEAVDLAELLEARFFSEREEIRIVQSGDGLRAVRLAAEEGDVCLPETRPLMNPRFGAELSLCQQVEFDGDGQAYISAARLTGWKGVAD